MTSLVAEDLGRCFFFASYANRICLSISVSLWPDFCLSSSSWTVTFPAGVVCSILSKGSAPNGGLVLGWGVLQICLYHL